MKKERTAIIGLFGANKEVHLYLDMGQYYKDFINAIPESSHDKEEIFTNNVKCIVWGAFYLESAINVAVKHILDEESVDDGIVKRDNLVWPLIEKAKSTSKFEFILDAYMSDQEKKKKFTAQVGNLFKLRNRLAHYKEPTIKLTCERTTEQQTYFDSETFKRDVCAAKKAAKFTNHKIVDSVLSINIQDRREIILEIGEWIEKSPSNYYDRPIYNRLLGREE